MNAFLSLVVIVLFSICICRQNAQWLKYQLIFLGETLKKKILTITYVRAIQNEILFSLVPHKYVFAREADDKKGFFPLLLFIHIFFSSKSLFICCHHCAMCSKNGASTKSIFFFSLTFESKLSFWVNAHTVDGHVIRVHRGIYLLNQEHKHLLERVWP